MEMNGSPLVGVVTPFYNTREYLAECIESVLRQTYQNWEYVLVDNHSTDGSAEIAQTYASRFPGKIRVIQPETFLAQVPNYNFGLQTVAAIGKYSKMVQADDWIYPECLEQLVVVAESDAKIAITSSYRLKGNRVLGEGLPYQTCVVEGPEVCRLQLRAGAFIFGTPTTMLYRSSIIERDRPFYDPNSFFDDTDCSYRVLRDWKFGFSHRVLSFSRVDDDSMRGQVKDFNPDVLDRFLQISRFGPVYLEEGEFAQLYDRARGEYYNFLARSLLAGRNAELWRYHLQGLESAGLRLDKVRLGKHAALEILNAAANPGRTGARAYRKLRSFLAKA